MMLLAIDCSAGPCAACVYDALTNRELGREVRDLGKGHAEHLMDVIARALESAGKSYADLDRIGVSVGPGSFTGVRVAVSAARGLALALKIPAVGVTTLEAIATQARPPRGSGEIVMAVTDAGREVVYAGIYDHLGSVLYHPAVMGLDEAAALASRRGSALAGSAAARVAALMEGAELTGFDGATADIGIYARLAAGREPAGRPAPLYLRPPDARPQAGFVLARRVE